jgi:hypothetical protein
MEEEDRLCKAQCCESYLQESRGGRICNRIHRGKRESVPITISRGQHAMHNERWLYASGILLKPSTVG